jgi:hypothetical protein
VAGKVTNKQLRNLLLDLGFLPGALVKNKHRLFEHSASRAVIVLPDNRDGNTARAADLLGVRDHLDQLGHLDEATFDRFVEEGKLPAA